MHRQPGLRLPSAAGAWRVALAVAAMLVSIGAPAQTRSETMPSSPASSTPAPSVAERLMQLVPDQVGAWKRHKLSRAPRRIDGTSPPSAEAEFRQGRQRVQLNLTQLKSPPPAPPAAPVNQETASGRERAYAEDGATVMEKTRKADGRTEVTVVRPDGLSITAQAIGVAAGELKALALGIKPAGP